MERMEPDVKWNWKQMTMTMDKSPEVCSNSYMICLKFPQEILNWNAKDQICTVVEEESIEESPFNFTATL